MTLVDRLREQAHDYELNALAQTDRGDDLAAHGFTVAALVTYSLANAIEETVEEDANGNPLF